MQKIKTILGYAGWAIIWTAVAVSIGYHVGSQNEASKHAAIKAAQDQAVKAVTPAPVAAKVSDLK